MLGQSPGRAVLMTVTTHCYFEFVEVDCLTYRQEPTPAVGIEMRVEDVGGAPNAPRRPRGLIFRSAHAVGGKHYLRLLDRLSSPPPFSNYIRDGARGQAAPTKLRETANKRSRTSLKTRETCARQEGEGTEQDEREGCVARTGAFYGRG